jgi:GT2 family glycosyltransferase
VPSVINISIIIINYNCLDLLDNCLASIFQFTTDCSFEIIVVDNHSTEGDVEQVTSKYSNVLLIKNERNVGFSAANNNGFTYAQGKYILILNNDTVFHENTLKIIFDFAESLNRESFIGCKLLNEDGSHQFSLMDFDTISTALSENLFIYQLFPRSKLLNRFHLNYKPMDNPIEVDAVKGAFIFCTASSIKKMNGFDTNFFFYGEETDLCYRFKKIGGKIYYFPNTSVYHLGGATTDKNLWFKYKNQSIAKIQFYQKHYNRIEALLLMSFHFIGLLIRVPCYFLMGVMLLKSSLLKKSFYYFRTIFVYPPNNFKNS